jgi:hypothetical protein
MRTTPASGAPGKSTSPGWRRDSDLAAAGASLGERAASGYMSGPMRRFFCLFRLPVMASGHRFQIIPCAIADNRRSRLDASAASSAKSSISLLSYGRPDSRE